MTTTLDQMSKKQAPGGEAPETVAAMPRPVGYGRYFLLLLAGVVAVCAVFLSLNFVVDPFWYFEGNRLASQNFIFNERISKTNRFINEKRDYDCLILGSSRTAFLNEAAITRHKCFNYAVANGRIGEFLKIGRYALAKGLNVDLVIVGVDGENFLNQPENPDLPDYITVQSDPPSVWTSYLSVHVAAMSVETLLAKAPSLYHYDGNFQARYNRHAEVGRFDPAQDILFSIEGRGTYRTDAVAEFAKLRAAFPKARLIGYVPPIHAHRISKMGEDRQLGGYLKAMHETSKAFDLFIDFSVPSAITADDNATFDGSHARPHVQDRVARILDGDPDSFGVVLNRLSLSDYRAIYRRAMERHFETASDEVTRRSIID